MYKEYPAGVLGTTRIPTFLSQYPDRVEIDNNLIWLHEYYMSIQSTYMLLPENYIGSKNKRKQK